MGVCSSKKDPKVPPEVPPETKKKSKKIRKKSKSKSKPCYVSESEVKVLLLACLDEPFVNIVIDYQFCHTAVDLAALARFKSEQCSTQISRLVWPHAQHLASKGVTRMQIIFADALYNEKSPRLLFCADSRDPEEAKLAQWGKEKSFNYLWAQLLGLGFTINPADGMGAPPYRAMVGKTIDVVWFECQW